MATNSYVTSFRNPADAPHVDAPPWFNQIVGDGVTLNDLVDADDGGNGLQNFPNVLSALVGGNDMLIEGFVETPLTSTTYKIEVFGNTECPANPLSSLGGFAYGQGEEWLATTERTPILGSIDFSFGKSFIGAPPPYVSLTVSRTDLGITSEFSRCMALSAPGDVASADVPAGFSGPVLDDRGVTVSVESAAALRRSVFGAATGAAGKLFVTRYERAPDRSVFNGAVATGPGGTDVEPIVVARRYWYLADRRLTAAGGATSGNRTFDICLDPAGVVQSDDMPEVVVIQRNETTGGVWVPRDTMSAPHGDSDCLCASGLTQLGELGFGLPALCGDLNASRTVTAGDALLVLRASVGGDQCAETPCVCDVNANGTVSASDALAVLRSAVAQTALDSCSC